MSKIKILESKMEHNEKLLFDVVRNVCLNTEFKTSLIVSLILNNNFDKIDVGDKKDKTYLKLSIINREFNKIQNDLKIQIDYEKASNTSKKVGFNLFEDLIKNKDVDYSKEETIEKFKEYCNNSLMKLYELRKIDVSYLKYDTNGLLLRDENNESFIKNQSFNKDLKIDFGKNNDGRLRDSDRILIHNINSYYEDLLTLHSMSINEFGFRK